MKTVKLMTLVFAIISVISCKAEVKNDLAINEPTESNNPVE